eukprot:101406-Chlamydomonas_euryale.AAC.3
MPDVEPREWVRPHDARRRRLHASGSSAGEPLADTTEPTLPPMQMTALKLNEEDQTTISALKKEIEKAWKMVDASHEKEAKAKETIQQLKVGVSRDRDAWRGAGRARALHAMPCHAMHFKACETAMERHGTAPVPTAMGRHSMAWHECMCMSCPGRALYTSIVPAPSFRAALAEPPSHHMPRLTCNAVQCNMLPCRWRLPT